MGFIQSFFLMLLVQFVDGGILYWVLSFFITKKKTKHIILVVVALAISCGILSLDEGINIIATVIVTIFYLLVEYAFLGINVKDDNN